MESERMDDTDNGGGRMTGNEVLTGNVNNMFSDISRLDRVKGRVSMRKGFVGAFTGSWAVGVGVDCFISSIAGKNCLSELSAIMRFQSYTFRLGFWVN